MSSNTLHPVTDRLVHLDVLRGFALLGILLVNFEWFLRPMQAIMLSAEPGLSLADQIADALVSTLAEGKFYPLFSMLFGAGFALMADRASKRAAPFWGVYLRRLLVLMAIGLIHTIVIWGGDVLLVYALSAFLMILLFRKTPVQRLWKWGLFFISVPFLLAWIQVLSIALAVWLKPELQAEIDAGILQNQAATLAKVAEFAQIHANGTFSENVFVRIDDTLFKLIFFPFWATPVIGFFLLGRWLIVSERLTKPNEHLMFFRRWRSRGLLVGLMASAMATRVLWDASANAPTLEVAMGKTLATLGGLLLALAYLSMITLSADRLRFLAPVGQMALTNYLMQSLVWTWVIYGHGLGLWGELPRWSTIPLALAFFGVQVVLSQWWMARYRFGPAEWLWRSLTYRQRQPMVR